MGRKKTIRTVAGNQINCFVFGRQHRMIIPDASHKLTVAMIVCGVSGACPTVCKRIRRGFSGRKELAIIFWIGVKCK